VRRFGRGRTVGIAVAIAILGAVLVPSTAAAADRWPPSTPTDLRVASLSVAGVTLAWNPSTDSSGWLLYEIQLDALPRDYRHVAAFGPGATFTNLLQGQTYTVTVLARDGDRNASGTVSTRFTVPVDFTPPTAPSGLRATTVRGTLDTLEWAPSVDETRVQYLIYSGTTLLTSTGVPRLYAEDAVFVECFVAPGSTHTLTVRARDASGHLSTGTEPLTVTFPRS
jgi:hypothetical protein